MVIYQTEVSIFAFGCSSKSSELIYIENQLLS